MQESCPVVTFSCCCGRYRKPSWELIEILLPSPCYTWCGGVKVSREEWEKCKLEQGGDVPCLPGKHDFFPFKLKSLFFPGFLNTCSEGNCLLSPQRFFPLFCDRASCQVMEKKKCCTDFPLFSQGRPRPSPTFPVKFMEVFSRPLLLLPLRWWDTRPDQQQKQKQRQLFSASPLCFQNCLGKEEQMS